MLRSTWQDNRAVSPTQRHGQNLVDPDDLRTLFAAALSAMYREEVPLYGDLVQIVQETNAKVLRERGVAVDDDSKQRISLERHGAIRLGNAYELQTVRRIFGLMGMYAVDYYDLSAAGLPMHATAFRPVESTALARNPFRVFTTLLRPELLKDQKARALAEKLLQRRSIFSLELLELLDVADRQDGCFTVDQIDQFVSQALLTFRWRSTAAATDLEYERLLQEHPILADIACFQSAHINHLTPRTLDIDAAYESMRVAGLAVKDSIEGPPRRVNPIFLRQTSFLALQESVQFPKDRRTDTRDVVHGHHKARFGEIEERGAALTQKGRDLYNKLLEKAKAGACAKDTAEAKAAVLKLAFRNFPDIHERMRLDGLIYCIYHIPAKSLNIRRSGGGRVVLDRALLDRLVAHGVLMTHTLIYEDFLPFSAAGIFQSNLQADGAPMFTAAGATSDLEGFQRALGAELMSSDGLYRKAELESIRICAQELGLAFDPSVFSRE